MSAGQIASIVKLTRKKVYERFYGAGIRGTRQEGTTLMVYPVSDKIRSKQEDKEEGYVSLEELSATYGICLESVKQRVCRRAFVPDHMGWHGRMMYEMTPELEHAVKNAAPVANVSRGNPRTKTYKSYGQESDALLDAERVKREWVGHVGRVVINGKETMRGIIQTVNACGVVIDGVPGIAIKEVELVD